jgi:spermidine synthase / saccharopine dehydrogenase (NADP+, L-glutamate-forming)
VIRVSKLYLPHMSALLSSPRVTVHIGDGFKYLAENTSKYDVIITDSSDPVGPAEELFKKPYFKLLYDALTPGGHISTQAECPWVHLPFIKELGRTTKELFPVAEYAITSIPTYPSGQIGFALCSKEAGRDLRTPVRDVEGTRYWSKEVHKAAFVLPEFARAYLEEGKDLRPNFGRELLKVQQSKQAKKILLLGSGFVARPCAEYIVRDPSNELTVGELHIEDTSFRLSDPLSACRTLKRAEALIAGLPNTRAISVDVGDEAALETEVAAHDLVISLIPYVHHAAVIKAAIKGKTHVVTTSYVSPAIRELDTSAKEAGIVVMNEIGLDPGIDHLYAVKTIDEVHDKGGKVRFVISSQNVC